MLKVLKVIGKIVFGVIKTLLLIALCGIIAFIIALLILWLMAESGTMI